MSGLTQRQIDVINATLESGRDARISQASQNPPREIFTQVFDLSTARLSGNPFLVPFQFTAFRILDATDSACYVHFSPNIPGTDDSMWSKYTNGTPFITQNAVAKGYFKWPAQSGKQLTVEFYRNSYTLPANFLSTVKSTTSGMSTQALPSAAPQSGSAATVLLAQDLSRTQALIQNQDTANSIYVGGGSDTTVKGGAKPGIEIPAGQTYTHDSTAALYWIVDSGVTLTNVSVTVFT